MFNRHPSTILRLNRKVNVAGNDTKINKLPKHIVTIRQQGQNMITSHMVNRTKTAVATASRITENHGRRISAHTVRNGLKAVGMRAKRMYGGSWSPYPIEIIEDGWLCQDATLEP